eukprot:5197080-Pyramimonas_sp.AAC.1
MELHGILVESIPRNLSSFFSGTGLRVGHRRLSRGRGGAIFKTSSYVHDHVPPPPPPPPLAVQDITGVT